MAKPKQRRKERKQRPTKKTPLTRIDGVVHIRAKKFVELRTNPDFVNLLRIGRALNTIILSYERIALAGTDENRHALGVRGTFILGGYAYEMLLLAKSIREIYEGQSFFDPFRKLLDRSNEREILRSIRNHAAFHLDWQDQVTTPTVSKLSDGTYPFMSFHETRIKGAYFDLSDAVDIAYFTQQFLDDCDEEKALEEMATVIDDFAMGLADAGYAFILGISAKLGLLPPKEFISRENRGEIVRVSERWL